MSAATLAADPISGPDLRDLRTMSRVTQVALARAMGIRRQRLQTVELLAAVPMPMATSYLAALRALSDARVEVPDTT